MDLPHAICQICFSSLNFHENIFLAINAGLVVYISYNLHILFNHELVYITILAFEPRGQEFSLLAINLLLPPT